MKDDRSDPFDLEYQETVASSVKRFDAIRARLGDLGARAESARIADHADEMSDDA